MLLLSFLISITSFANEHITADHVRVSWVAPKSFAKNVETIGIRFQLDPEWHVYWKNPGDSGAAPKFSFAAKDMIVDSVSWPYPKRLPLGDLVNLGYEEQVVFPFKVHPQSNDAELIANLEWLVCKEDCIPGFGKLTLKRPIEDSVQWVSSDKELLDKFISMVPNPNTTAPQKIESAEMTDMGLLVKLSGIVDLFPLNGNFVMPASPKINGTQLLFKTAGGFATPPSTGFVMVADNKAWEFPSVSIDDVSDGMMTLLFFAFLGGILLNLMPCVFPVLFIKALSLVKSNRSRQAMANEGFFYTAGVLVTFFFLGSLFLVLKSAGNAVGWGFHLQSPIVILALVLLFWIMALNFLGVFEFGNSVMNWAGKHGRSSSFFTGMLSVFVATPCTGPFMGTALGATATLPPAQSLGIFLSLGFGLAFPFLILTLDPTLSRKLPKPGPWMEKLKQFFAFPLFATVLWLLWVLGSQTGTNGWIWAGILILEISFGFWALRFKSMLLKSAVWIFILVTCAYSFQNISPVQKQTQAETWVPYDKIQLQSARTQGRPVFVDFTAAWCITCQVNKKTVLETDSVNEIFQSNDVLLIRADWTNLDDKITEALAEFGRNSVPVYVYYPPQGDPQVLPQILTTSIIKKLFNPKEVSL